MRFVVVDLGRLPDCLETTPTAINNEAQIVGYCAKGAAGDAGGTVHAFVWLNGTIKPLRTLGWEDSAALGINDRGDIVGYAGRAVRTGFKVADLDLSFPAVAWPAVLNKTPGEWSQQIPMRLGPANGVALGINNLRAIVGQIGTAYLYRSGRFSRLHFKKAVGINDGGDIIGYNYVPDRQIGEADTKQHGFLWHHGAYVALKPANGIYAAPAAINRAGLVAGTAYFANGHNHACVWNGGVFRDLGTLGGNNSEATALNGDGVVVGAAEGRDGKNRACLWLGDQVIDLNASVEGHIDGMLAKASGINDKQEIVGYGYVPKAAGIFGFVLKPQGPSAE